MLGILEDPRGFLRMTFFLGIMDESRAEMFLRMTVVRDDG